MMPTLSIYARPASKMKLSEMANKLRTTAATMGNAGNAKAQTVAKAILRSLVFDTPVDTSRALSNWEVGLGSPQATYIPAYFVGEKGSTQAQSAERAYAVGAALIDEKKPGQPLYISNVAPYIVILNDGTHSKQPGGFVERAELLGRKLGATVRATANGRQ